MIVEINPSKISGEIYAPASKSSMQRACAAAVLATGKSVIRHPGISNDDLASLEVIQKLGARVTTMDNGDLSITSNGVLPVSHEINCGESGLGMRMFAPLAALSDQQIVLNGKGSLLDRPMNFFDEVFPLLGIEVKSTQGKLPVTIRGPLQPADISIDGSLSSQFLTGLLMAYAAAGASGVRIRVTNLKSRPYIDLTLEVLKHFGVNIVHRDYEEFFFDGTTTLVASDYTVEGDWSGGAFLLVAGAIAGNITVQGLDVSSSQADKAILQALASCGAYLSVTDSQIAIGPGKLNAFHFDATDCPDLFPPLVALASYCAGTTAIAGVGRLEHKESNRALTLQDEFGKLGITINLQGDMMFVEGGNGLTGNSVHSRHDHRIAMACAVAGLKANGKTIIEDAEAVNKSYPAFYDDLMRLGVDVIIQEPVNT